jgi:SNF2 family DNA or RNA helicase
MAALKPLWNGFHYQDHQITGVRWMLEREALQPSGGILCDEMGLGKTIQVLGVVNQQKANATLLVAPLATLDQWQETAERSGFCVWRCHSSKDEWQLPKNFRVGGKHLYVVNYERAIARPGLVNQRVWPRAVFDEAHRMADPTGQCFLLAQSEVKAKTRWFLTATPVVNSLRDAISLFRLLGHEDLSASRVDELEGVIKNYVLCRRMCDLRGVVEGLPDAAKEFEHILDFETSDEAEFYRGIQGIIQRRFRMLQHEEGGQQEMFRLIMRLRQISIHPQVYIGARKKEWRTYNRADWDDPSTKFVRLKALIESQSAEPHRWLVFCHFHEEMQLLQDYLMMECPIVRDCSLYSGAQSAKERAAAIETSKSLLIGSQQEVLLVQLQSGGTGLNLQHCDRIVFMGPWWTAALMDQAIGRAVRIGQNDQVEVHRLILKEEASMNIDKKMLSAAERKRELCLRFLSIARGSDAGSDPTVDSDNDESDDSSSVASAHSFEQLPVIADDENPH